jgi:gamma-glutamylcyclotransferase (GGCT)/AIG2-like uncharacterized protein YtfP
MTKETTHRVFVYGTLMRNHHNHRILKENTSYFLGEARTVESYMMLYAGIPYVIKADAYYDDHMETHPVKGEVYEVDDVTLARLDRLEGYQAGREGNHYNREEIDVMLRYGPDKAFIYFGGEHCLHHIDNPVLPNMDGLLVYPGIRWEDDETEEYQDDEKA